jgi:hypothetical protein
MKTIGAGLMDYVNAAKEKMGLGSTPVQKTAEDIVAPLPDSSSLGLQADARPGYTSAGGKRLKTRSASKKRKSSVRKTRSLRRKGGRKY